MITEHITPLLALYQSLTALLKALHLHFSLSLFTSSLRITQMWGFYSEQAHVEAFRSFIPHSLIVCIYILMYTNGYKCVYLFTLFYLFNILLYLFLIFFSAIVLIFLLSLLLLHISFLLPCEALCNVF